MRTQPGRSQQQEQWLERVAQFERIAGGNVRLRFNALMGLVSDPQGLRSSFEAQPGNKAAGVDGVRKAEYGQQPLLGSPISRPCQACCVGHNPI